MKRLLFVALVAFLVSCGSKPEPGPLPVTLGELLDAHNDKSYKYRGLVVRLQVLVTDVEPASHSVCRRLKPGLSPVVRVYFDPKTALPEAGNCGLVATVLAAEPTGDTGMPDVHFTLILTDGRVQD